MKLKLILAVVAAWLTVLSPVVAHEGATGIVKERMDAMKEMAKALKDASRRIESNRNLAAVRTDAEKIRDTAPRIAGWFPPDSLQPPTDAKPAIWQRWEEFQTFAGRLEAESAALITTAASGDPKAIADQFQRVGFACSACHEPFRAKH